MIELINISKSYNQEVNAVNNLSLNIPSGQITGFIGPNGAGKTTTLKMITGILKQDKGAIIVNGADTLTEPIKTKSQIGFVPDSPDIFLRLKGIEYLNFIADIFKVNSVNRKRIISELAEKFEISEALSDKMQSYSHGMRQKIIIIGMLLHSPEVFVLDEPLTGLDPKASFILKELLREYADKNKTIFFSTHILEVAEKLCDRVAIINKGVLQFYGTMDEMKNHFRQNSSLENIFLEITENG
ncbi:MAG: ABC transporter ATP-binding protein [Bacteroidota bacterium]|nr:ABC transporter ATP-binding protein [Bacteroidota bacterium]